MIQAKVPLARKRKKNNAKKTRGIEITRTCMILLPLFCDKKGIGTFYSNISFKNSNCLCVRKVFKYYFADFVHKIPPNP